MPPFGLVVNYVGVNDACGSAADVIHLSRLPFDYCSFLKSDF